MVQMTGSCPQQEEDALSIEADKQPMPSRKDTLRMASHLLDDRIFDLMMANAANDTDKRVNVTYRAWAHYGFQSVQMPATYAAGLMATDAHNALDGELRFPWPAFEILVPTGLLESGHGPVDIIHVMEIPALVAVDEKNRQHRIMIVYQDSRSWGVRTFIDLKHMFEGEEGYSDDIPAGLANAYDEDKEQRCWSLLTRLVAGVVLAIAEERIDRPGAFPQRPVRQKHGVPKANTVNLGKPLKIDCRPAIRAFLNGERTRELTLSTWVRGHWRNQAYGPQWSLHRRRWVQPFNRGQGPLTIRPTHLGGIPDKETR